jgi:hypothetical protein
LPGQRLLLRSARPGDQRSSSELRVDVAAMVIDQVESLAVGEGASDEIVLAEAGRLAESLEEHEPDSG